MLGANNAGKTSILNAIQMLLPLQDYRGRQEAKVVSNTNYLIKNGILSIEGELTLLKEQWASLIQTVEQNPQFKIDYSDISPLIEILTENTFIWNRTYSLIGRNTSNRSNTVKFSAHLYNFSAGKYSSILDNLIKLLPTTDFYNIYRTPLYLDSKGQVDSQEEFKPLNELLFGNPYQQPNQY